MTKKRARGRPKGTGIDDAARLERVADIMIKNPGQSATSAINRVIGSEYGRSITTEQEASIRRRLQRKWRVTCSERMEAARERLRELTPVRYQEPVNVLDQISGLHSYAKRINDSLRPTGLSRALEQVRNVTRVHDEILEASGAKAFRQQVEQIRRLNDMMNPPALRHLREISERMRITFGRADQ